MQFLQRVGNDLIDRGAEQAPEGGMLDVLKVAVPGVLGGIAPITGPLHDLLKDHLLADFLVRALVPVVLAILCFRCIFAREKVAPVRVAGFHQDATAEPTYRYVFTQPLRQTAKITALPMSALGVMALFPLVPAGPRTDLGGYVCLPDDGKSAGVAVDAVNALGVPLTLPAPIDTSGWFLFSSLPRGLPLTAFKVNGAPCEGVTFREEEAQPPDDGCPRRGDPSLRRQHGHAWPVWVLRCPTKHEEAAKP